MNILKIICCSWFLFVFCFAFSLYVLGSQEDFVRIVQVLLQGLICYHVNIPKQAALWFWPALCYVDKIDLLLKITLLYPIFTELFM